MSISENAVVHMKNVSSAEKESSYVDICLEKEYGANTDDTGCLGIVCET